jgi:hypothetical protein
MQNFTPNEENSIHKRNLSIESKPKKEVKFLLNNSIHYKNNKNNGIKIDNFNQIKNNSSLEDNFKE